MNPARRPGRLTAWIAIFAVLLAALAPSVARALSPPQQAMPWSDICTVVGTPAAPATEPMSGSGQHQDAGFKHCPLCLNHAGHAALPAAPTALLPVAGSAELFASPASPTSSRFTRAAAQPRAPPPFS